MKPLPIILGIIGAVVGFAATMALFAAIDSGARDDAITRGMIVLVFIAPLGAIGGLVLGTRLGMAMSRGDVGGFGSNLLKAGITTVVLVAVIGGGVAAYMISTATPWLRPNGVMLVFEVRLPEGAAAPAPGDVKAELQTDINTMPAEIKADKFRRDDNRAVIAAEVDLAFRTAYRQIEVKVPGQPDRVFPIKLAARAPHAPALGAWQKNADGSEIRYRAKWPGED